MEETLEQPSYIDLLKPKVKNPGIIYLNYIPKYMTVKKIREYFTEFGEVRRLFLKPEKPKKTGKPSKFFSEGWVEFARKKIAKQVASCLNGTQVGGKRHTPYYDALWSIKYLHKFQWSQLHEKQAYQKAKKQQRMRAEIAQVKREVNFYTKGVEKKKRMKRKEGEEDSNRILENAVQQNAPPVNAEKSSDERSALLLRKIFGNE